MESSSNNNNNNNPHPPYLIIVAVQEGRNIDVPDTFYHDSERQDLQIFLEARFDEEVLVSDGISFRSSHPDINTELAWEMDRKTLHQFRIERKPIKLQCFVENCSSGERLLIGYSILDVRSAQETSSGSPEAKFEWRTMLNSKYKGDSKLRPELLCSLQLVRGESETTSYKPEVHQSYASIESSGTSFRSLDSIREDQVEMDIQVKDSNGYFRIWDSKRCSEDDCHQKYQLSVVIASASHLQELLSQSSQVSSDAEYFFRYCLLGSIICTKPFSDVINPEIPPEKVTLKIEATDLHILKTYFSLNSRLEIELCQRIERNERILGSTIVLINCLIGRKNITPVAGEFMLIPADNDLLKFNTSSGHHLESQARIGVYIELEKVVGSSPFSFREKRTPTSANNNKKPPIYPPAHVPSSHGNNSNGDLMKNGRHESPGKHNSSHNSYKNISEDQGVRHFCFSIDIRSISRDDHEADKKRNSPCGSSSVLVTHPCFIQYSYAFFGLTEKTSTSLVSLRESNTSQTFKDGFFAFNFATSYQQMSQTFSSASLILELIEKTNVNMLRGIALVNLAELLSCNPDEEMKRLMVVKPYVMNSDEETIAQLNVILCLQDLGPTSLGKTTLIQLNESDLSDVDTIRSNSNKKMTAYSQVEKLFVEAAVEVELWKKQEMKRLKEEVRRKESQVAESLLNNKLSELKKIEDELQETLNRVREKESLLNVKEKKLDLTDQSMKQKYGQMEKEISQSISELTSEYEEKLSKEKDRSRLLEEKLSLERERVRFLDDQNRLLTLKVTGGSNDLSVRKSSFVQPSSPVSKRRTPPAAPSSSTVLSSVSKSPGPTLTRTNSVPNSVRSASRL